MTFLVIAISTSQNAFAQSITSDCSIYESILQYFNDEYAKDRYVYFGIIDPVDPKPDSSLRTGKYQYDFHIVNKKSEFGISTVKPWFSNIVKDNSIVKCKYSSSRDSIMKCEFSTNIKSQYTDFESFQGSDKSQVVIKGSDTIHYTLMRVTFSEILFSKNIALVYANIFQGVGRGSDIMTYGFVFRRKGKNWIIKKVRTEVR